MSFAAGQRITAGELNAISAMQLIQTNTLTATTASVTITVPSGYNSLNFSWHSRTTSANTNDDLSLTLNSDSGANYDWQIVATLNTTTTATVSIGSTGIRLGTTVGGTGSAGYFGNGNVWLTGVGQAGSGHNLTVTGNWYACWSNTAATSSSGTVGALYRPSTAITSVTITPNGGVSFAAGSVFSLYGLG